MNSTAHTPTQERAEKAETELDALKRDLAMRPSSLTTLYQIREAMGYNKFTSLDILARDCQSVRRVLSGEIAPDAGLLDLAEAVMRRLKHAEDWREQFDCCMCGSRMDAHDIGAGHSPVSMYDYHLWQLQVQRDEMLAALKKAEQFVANGVEFGFIRMPYASTPDPAHDTLPAIRAAIARATGAA